MVTRYRKKTNKTQHTEKKDEQHKPYKRNQGLNPGGREGQAVPDSYKTPIMLLIHKCHNIPAAPVIGVYISRLIGHSNDLGSNHDFLEKWLVLKRKLPMVPIVKLKSSLQKFYGCLMT